MNKQLEYWTGEDGDEYTTRNPYNAEQTDEEYKKKYGITRTKMNKQFLKGLPKDMRILEVGCNQGNQLDVLWDMGFSNLWGVEPNISAMQIAREGFNVVPGTGFDIPFKDNFFDLVMVSGVHIHIHPKYLDDFMREVMRCTKKYIFIFEYFSNTRTEISYRDKTELLWKNDFCLEYVHLLGLKVKNVVAEKYVFNKDPEKLSHMFLLEITK